MAAILAEDQFEYILLNENDRMPIRMSLKCVPMSPIDNNAALVQVMALNRRQACTWTNVDPVHRCIYAASGRNLAFGNQQVIVQVICLFRASKMNRFSYLYETLWQVAFRISKWKPGFLPTTLVHSWYTSTSLSHVHGSRCCDTKSMNNHHANSTATTVPFGLFSQ